MAEGIFLSQRRIKAIFFMFLTAVAILNLRMFYLQIIFSGDLSKSASAQRAQSSVIDSSRGDIVDRNGIRLTNRSTQYNAVLKPVFLRDDPETIFEIAELLNLEYSPLKNKINTGVQPIIFEADKFQKDVLLSLKSDGISIIYSKKRYDPESVARHILGYLNKSDGIGQSGVEKRFESVMRGEEINKIAFIKDAGNNLVEGKGYRIIKEDGDSDTFDVKLTIDYHIQKIVESVAKEAKISGAIVVEDVYTGDIVAIASFPDFNQNNIEYYLNSTNNELYNRATAAYSPGSIFKIIDAAVFLNNPDLIEEDGSEYYYCDGYIRAGGNIFKCASYDRGGHGELSLTEAFAHSCNSYFINMAIRSGYTELIHMAELFGLGNYTGINEQGIVEEKGNLPDPKAYYSSGDIANMSIGQGVVMATPLQVADIVATIANGGIKNKINIVDSIVDRDGNEIKKIKVHKGQRIISKENSQKIKGMMEAVTLYGTGKAAALKDFGGAAGKTGSAETGKKDVVHAWFAGYFPINNPKYSIAVLVENGQYGGEVAAPIFAEIASEIMLRFD
jgi:penicillin-binding protein 2